MKRLARSCLAACLMLGFSQVALSAGSLCKANEEVYFSCAAKNGKIISLCGKAFSTDKFGARVELDSPWLQYRFGSLGNIELAYPATKTDSISRFRSQRIRAQGGEIHLDAIAFVSDGIGYSVESVAGDGGALSEGVSVGKPADFDLAAPAKPRVHYPKAQVQCAGSADTRKFFDLVDYLAE